MANVFDSYDGAGRSLPDNYVFKFVSSNEPSRGAERLSKLLVLWRRRRPDLAGRRLNVLLFNRRYDVAGDKSEFCHHVGTNPYAHAVVSATKEINLGHTWYSEHLVAQVYAAVVDQKVCI